jgi:hypothetical protein
MGGFFLFCLFLLPFRRLGGKVIIEVPRHKASCLDKGHVKGIGCKEVSGEHNTCAAVFSTATEGPGPKTQFNYQIQGILTLRSKHFTSSYFLNASGL